MGFAEALKAFRKENIISVKIEELTPNPLQPRRDFNEEELQALSNSIKTYGLIQPIAVKKIEPLPFPMPEQKAKYEIIAGERRWRASRLAGLKTINCILFEADRTDSAMMALVENVQRSDLSYFEEALAMQTLLLMSGKTQAELARALAISQATLSNKLRLLRLSERERLMAMENGFSERHCRALVRIDSEKERRPIMLKIIRDKLQSKETEKLIDDVLKAKSNPQPEKVIIKKKKPHIKGVIRDMRFLFNTLDKTVGLLSASGYKASWSKEEAENGLDVHIKIIAVK